MRQGPLPFVLGERGLLDRLPSHCGSMPLIKLPINGPSTVPLSLDDQVSGADSIISPVRFARLLNVANGLAYGGGMGMPEWVMLDCALLPAFFSGWMNPAHLLPQQLFDALNQGRLEQENARSKIRASVEQRLGILEGDLTSSEWVPTAEFCSIPRLLAQRDGEKSDQGEVVGYSLYSLERGLGVRAKALGLWLCGQLGIKRQVGVAQWSNLSALNAHLRFGPLELIDPMTPLHTRAGETMVYRLTLPAEEALRLTALGQAYLPKRDHPEQGQWVWANDVEYWLTLRAAYTEKDHDLSGKVWLLAARKEGDRVRLFIKVDDAQL